jgi:uncharacterized membrane protein YphA (DoxX/SURF4 family)
MEMQRLFSMFPGGSAGLALMILRVSAGSSLLLCAFTRGQLASPSWVMFGLGSIVILMGIGALTPVACSLGALIEAYYILHSHGADELQAILALLITVALALLGPGAFSVDAKLFGRRLIIPS